MKTFEEIDNAFNAALNDGRKQDSIADILACLITARNLELETGPALGLPTGRYKKILTTDSTNMIAAAFLVERILELVGTDCLATTFREEVARYLKTKQPDFTCPHCEKKIIMTFEELLTPSRKIKNLLPQKED